MLLRQRPYHVENTSSRPITEVKQRWARLVLGWVTAWEHRVPLASNLLIFVYQWFSDLPERSGPGKISGKSGIPLNPNFNLEGRSVAKIFWEEVNPSETWELLFFTE